MQPLFYCRKNLLGVASVSAKYLEIIGISHDIAFLETSFSKFRIDIALVQRTVFQLPAFVRRACGQGFPLACHPPVQFIEDDVGE